MPKLWGGRFTSATDRSAYEFNASSGFDKKMYKEDIAGSIAHARMLGKCGIISSDESSRMIDALIKIREDLESDALHVTDEYEDIHSFVETILTERIGDIGKKLHTGRSRNDQVALDMKLYTRNQIKLTDKGIFDLQNTLFDIIKNNTDTYMPGFTHLQKAQPVTLAHHMSAYFEMFIRDRERLKSIFDRMNSCPLGSGALAGTTYDLDREYTAELLLFDKGPTRNSMDSVSDRDYLIEFLSALSIIMMHLSRFSEEIIIWNSNEYSFVEIDDRYSTGSSIMPQKKNPDIAELVRGKTGRVYGSLMSLLTTMKGIPLAYDKDMQEDKEVSFDAMETVHDCLREFNGMLSTITFNKNTMEKSARQGFTNATDAADYLVKKGVPFRDAHSISGRLVLKAISLNTSLDGLSLSDYKEESDLFEEDIYDAISLKTCVEKRVTFGAPGSASMKKIIRYYDEYLKEEAGLWKN
ncbi:MAG: argininosuccinate lyase [Lachnospiraceae bacterium]|nr:argininosuccinate lyase [Lachnospiraceae bacterium]